MVVGISAHTIRGMFEIATERLKDFRRQAAFVKLVACRIQYGASGVIDYWNKFAISSSILMGTLPTTEYGQ